MPRPRISQKEATYLVTFLEMQTEELKQKYENTAQLERDYDRIIFELKHPVQAEYDEKGNFVDNFIWGDRERKALVRLAMAIKEKHPNLQSESFQLYRCVNAHEVLLKKYKAIANGEPHDGRYKKLRVKAWQLP